VSKLTRDFQPFAIHMQGPEKIDGRYVQLAEFLCFTFPINLT
jgi:aspartyl-tRNA(Asn)/glutamyl-tRNA(Gln) amidotransferase subunit A